MSSVCYFTEEWFFNVQIEYASLGSIFLDHFISKIYAISENSSGIQLIDQERVISD